MTEFRSGKPLSPLDAELVWFGIEGAYLCELNFGINGVTSSEPKQARAEIAPAVVRLVEDGLIEVGIVSWEHWSDWRRDVSLSELIEMLDSGSAWSIETDDRLFIRATERGRETSRQR